MAEKKRVKMVLGFNHNIKHKGKIYHVQTEDSGIDNPHIITHLFVGGNILATKKTSYADIVNAENLEEIVRQLMKEQHKAMLKNLVNGVYDDVEVPGSGTLPHPAAVSATPGNVATDTIPPLEPASRPAPAGSESAPQERFPAPAVSVPPPPRTQTAIPRHEAPTVQQMPAAAGKSVQVPSKPITEEIPSSPSTPQRPSVTLRAGNSAPPESRPAAPQPSQSTGAEQLPPEVLAARRLAQKPVLKDTSGPTIFGEDLISEKSLDEVILSYLSGEGEGG